MPHPPPAPARGPARVVIVDDHPGVLAALSRVLTGLDDIALVGVALDGEGGLELCRRLRPDVVLMDLSMPGLDGVEATRRIVADGSARSVVIITSASGARLAQARAAGAVACVLKHEPNAVIIEAVRAAALSRAPAAPA